MAENSNWGYVSQEDVSSKSFNNWHFGLNQDVRLKKIEFVEPTEKNGKSYGAYVYVCFGHKEDEDEKHFKKVYIWEPNPDKIYGKEGLITDKNSEEWKKGMERSLNTVKRQLFDIAECFVSVEKITSLLKTKTIESFKDFANLIISICNKYNNDTSVDLFLQYATKLYEGKAVLEIPNANMGHFVTKHYEGDYREEAVVKHHLYYYLYENDVKTDKLHPICRGNYASWWDNNYAKVEVKSENEKKDDVSWIDEKQEEKNKSDVSWDDIL